MTDEKKEVTPVLLAGIEKRHGGVGGPRQAGEMEIEVRARGDGLWRPELDVYTVFQADRGCTGGMPLAISRARSCPRRVIVDKCGEADQAGYSFIRWMTSFPRLA